jgi:hypothetical protein
MPLDTAWAAALQVEDQLGGYGSFSTVEYESEFVVPVSMDGAYRVAIKAVGDWAEVSILANGERYRVLSWDVADRGWDFFVNDTGERQAGDEIAVSLVGDTGHGLHLDVVLAGLTVSSWSEHDAFARILPEAQPV